MSNGSGIGVDVLVDELDECIEKLKDEKNHKKPSTLCGIHGQAILVLCRVERYRMLRFRRAFRFGAITSSVIGLVSALIYAAVKLIPR